MGVWRILTFMYFICYLGIIVASASDDISNAYPLWFTILGVVCRGAAALCILLYFMRYSASILAPVWKLVLFAVVGFDIFADLRGTIVNGSDLDVTTAVVVTVGAIVTLCPSWYICFRFAYGTWGSEHAARPGGDSAIPGDSGDTKAAHSGPLVILGATILIGGFVAWTAYRSQRITSLLEDLRSNDDARVAAAAEELSHYTGAPAIRVMIESFDGDQQYGKNLGKVFARMGSPAVAPLVSFMTRKSQLEDTPSSDESAQERLEEHDDLLRRSLCSYSLTAIGEPAVEPLIVKLSTKNAMAPMSEYALHQIGKPAVPALIKALRSPDQETKHWCLLALSGLADVGATEAIAAIVRDTTQGSGTRYTAVCTLGRIEDARAFDTIVAALQDTDSFVRDGALTALGHQKDPRAVDRILSIASASPAGKRGNAMRGMTEHNEPRVVAFLIDAVAGNDPTDRDDAIGVLVDMKDPRLAEPLIEKFNCASGQVRNNIAIALSALGGDKARAVVDSALAGADVGKMARDYRACIEKGVPGTEWLLAIALYRHGTVIMARDYWASGNGTLSDASLTWMGKNRIKSVARLDKDAPHPIWGSNHSDVLPIESTAAL